MYSSALMAFLHHVAAFTVVAALAVEVALFKPPLSLAQAQRLSRTDTIYGVSAGVVLVVGLLRVAYFEKGTAYYWHDVFFLLKFAAFLVTALISIYPTVIFLSWRPTLKAGTYLRVWVSADKRIYQQVFERQGSFPVFERTLP